MRKTPNVVTGLEHYGQKWTVQPSNQFEIELKMFGMGNPEARGGLTKEQHFKNILRMGYPWVLDNWHDWNEMCLWAWCNYTNIGVGGPAASHKTFTFSLLSSVEFTCRPMETAVIMTSTSLPALKTRLWPRFKEFHKVTIDGRKYPLPFHIQESKTMIQAVEGDDEHSIRAVAVDKGRVEQAIGKIIGNHPGRVVLVIDEAAQTEQAIFEAKNNLAVGTSFFRCVAIANPISRFDNHGTFCEPKNGWNSVSVNDEQWETKNGVFLHFDGLKSPNVMLGEQRYPKLFSRVDVERIRRDEGEDSLAWWSQCRGFWAPSGISNTVLDEAKIVAGKAREGASWEKDFIVIAALDPAFTSGGDRCILRFARVGRFTDGVFGMELFDTIQIQLSVSSDIPINYQIADRVKLECEARGVKPHHFSGDFTAATGLADIIGQRWSNDIRRVNFGGKATDRPVSDLDARPASDVYGNKVSELWFSFERMVVARKVRGLDTATGIEFCSREYHLRGEKKIVEPKPDMKERLSGRSPDLADPAALLSDIFRDMDVTTTETPAQNENDVDWVAIAKRQQSLYTKGYKAA